MSVKVKWFLVKVVSQSNTKVFKVRSCSIVFKFVRKDARPKPCLKPALCFAGVSFLEGKEDVFEDWREKFFNTWKVRSASAAARNEGKSPFFHTR